MSNRNILIMLGIVVVVGIITYSILLYSSPIITDNNIAPIPIKDDVSEKKYESENIKISFDYPSNLFIEESSNFLQITPIPSNDPLRQSSGMMGALSISFKSDQTLESTIRELQPVTLSVKDFVLNNHSVKEITSKPDGYSGSTWTYLLVKTDTGVFQISYLKDTEQAPTYQSIINSIKFR